MTLKSKVTVICWQCTITHPGCTYSHIRQTLKSQWLSTMKVSVLLRSQPYVAIPCGTHICYSCQSKGQKQTEGSLWLFLRDCIIYLPKFIWPKSKLQWNMRRRETMKILLALMLSDLASIWSRARSLGCPVAPWMPENYQSNLLYCFGNSSFTWELFGKSWTCLPFS